MHSDDAGIWGMSTSHVARVDEKEVYLTPASSRSFVSAVSARSRSVFSGSATPLSSAYSRSQVVPLNEPHLASPGLAWPRLTSPGLAAPDLASLPPGVLSFKSAPFATPVAPPSKAAAIPKATFARLPQSLSRSAQSLSRSVSSLASLAAQQITEAALPEALTDRASTLLTHALDLDDMALANQEEDLEPATALPAELKPSSRLPSFTSPFPRRTICSTAASDGDSAGPSGGQLPRSGSMPHSRSRSGSSSRSGSPRVSRYGSSAGQAQDAEDAFERLVYSSSSLVTTPRRSSFRRHRLDTEGHTSYSDVGHLAAVAEVSSVPASPALQAAAGNAFDETAGQAEAGQLPDGTSFSSGESPRRRLSNSFI